MKKKGKNKGKGHPITGHEGPEGEQMYSCTLPSTSALDGSGCSTPRPGRFTPKERPGTHCIGGWVSPQGRYGRVLKISPTTGSDPRTFQPVASRYTDWATPAPKERTNMKHKNLTYLTCMLGGVFRLGLSKRMDSVQNFCLVYYSQLLLNGARGDALGWGTEIETGISRLRFPIMSL